MSPVLCMKCAQAHFPDCKTQADMERGRECGCHHSPGELGSTWDTFPFGKEILTFFPLA